VGVRYHSPPGWPAPPPGWTPPPGWRPEPAWGPAPPGWQFWVDDGVPAPGPVVVRSSTGPVLIALTAVTCGLTSSIAPLWAATRRGGEAMHRRRLYALALVLLAALVVGAALIGTAPEDADGSPTGRLSDLGAALVFANWIAGIAVAVLVRNAGAVLAPQPVVEAPLPGVAEALARRRLRERYRQLATDDPALAQSMGIGRPDLPHAVDDGGLVDLNGVPAERIGELTGLPAEEAVRVAEVRGRLGRFENVDDVVNFADLPESSAQLLRERAIFS
jgi:hypothetical protein